MEENDSTKKSKKRNRKPRWMLVAHDGRPIIGHQEMYYFTLIAAIIDSFQFWGSFHKIVRVHRREYIAPKTTSINTDRNVL